MEEEKKRKEKCTDIFTDFWEMMRKKTFVLSLVFILLIWTICTLYTLFQATYSDINLGHRLTVTAIVLLIITIFSFFPAIIYGLFDQWGRDRAAKKTQDEIKHLKIKLYENITDEINTATEHAYDPGAYMWPVMLTTSSMVLGWALVFFSEGPNLILGMMKHGSASFMLNNLGNSHPVVFGFLGAFFWSLGTLFHRYINGDLKATVFINIAQRIWIVLILTVVLAVVWTGYDQFWIFEGSKSTAPKVLLAVSFIVGIFPNIGLELIKKAAKNVIRFKSTTKEISLNEIQGLSLWDQGRLNEEGIQNVQNLATSDVVGLIVNTRLRVMSLLNWVDQAILIIHATNSYRDFQKAGILMATDFEAKYAGWLDEEQCKALDKQRERGERVTYLGRKGITYFTEPDDSKIPEILQKEGLTKGQLHDIMVVICDDINYQRLWQIRHGRSEENEEK